MVSSKKKWTVVNPIRRQMKKRNPSSGQNGQLVHWWLLIHSGLGKGPEYRPSCDFRSVPDAGRLREQVKNHGRARIQVLFLLKAELGFFRFLEIVTGWLVPFAG